MQQWILKIELRYGNLTKLFADPERKSSQIRLQVPQYLVPVLHTVVKQSILLV
jgi:hypothetical protein